ncbi:DnaA regulatory inactivator Hda [uncultured Umboniibacter sp.]|uniref:DnaA regulatory inactivator Hda n=1 Tax=uncultured Umboniibacter sp. TaxID=1798917 RepID=UPI00262C104F|nr:DnaA regulatory inactivator Hda [uncultured Umboniibacter sp.]
MWSERPQQLALNVNLNDEPTLDNFFIGANQTRGIAVQSVRQQPSAIGDFLIYLWGPAGVGKTHLAKAAAHQFAQDGLSAAFIRSSEDLVAFAASIEQQSHELVIIDNLENYLGSKLIETALFEIYNWLRDSGRRLLVTAESSPRHLITVLRDLKSRLTWGGIFHLEKLADDELITALQLRCNNRGMKLSDELATYIIHRAPRDANVIFAVLERLDSLTLEQKRLLTIPFVREVMGW